MDPYSGRVVALSEALVLKVVNLIEPLKLCDNQVQRLNLLFMH